MMRNKSIYGMLVLGMILGMSACGEVQTVESRDVLLGEAESASDEAAESSKNSEMTQNIPEQSFGITIALPSSELHLSANKWYDRLVEEVNEYVQAEITWKWYDNKAYYQKMEADMVSCELADVIITEKSDAFLEAAEKGMFWDLSSYLDEYDNFSAIPEISRIGASSDGKIYGIPRKGRFLSNCLGYRVDWLEKLQLEPPKDWESFCKMLYAFTYNDPDGNGVNDTVGLALDSSGERWDAMELWFGTPNEWGIDENGDLIHKTRTQEYRKAYDAFRELYAQGVINNGENGVEDFRQVATYRAIDSVQASQAGATIDFIEHYGNVQKVFIEQGMTSEDNILFVPQAYVDTGMGAFCHTHKRYGMDGMIAVSTQNIKTEEQLKKVLQVLNDMSDGACEILLTYGWMDETYCITEDNHIEYCTLTGEQVKEGMLSYNDGFGEITTSFIAEENANLIPYKVNRTMVQQLIQQVTEENISYCVPNYGLQYMSETYNEKGAELDAMLWEAELKYITGEIDKLGFEEALAAWWTSGGEAVTKEKNEKYHAAKAEEN